jgi:aldehyde:ferredoxin oxidoreductase
MSFGYTGSILHIDLSTKKIEIENPPEDFYRTYVGGGAMGLYYILKALPANTDPLSPINILTFMCSVTTGAAVPGQSRINVNAKSPMTGGIGDSQAGGFFPAELKFAGFDGIVIKGKSPEPVYLWINDGKVEIRDASHLWGKTTKAVDTLIKDELNDHKAQVAQIGPAAENGVLFSSIVNMVNRNNGRTGMGTVMASKNLKAIAVRGTKKINVANLGLLTSLAKQGAHDVSENPDVDGLAKHGTASVVSYQNDAGTFPTRNYTEGQFEEAAKISGETMTETILKKADTCFACSVRCKRVVEAEKDGYKVDPAFGGPEYETIGTFGSYCGISDLEAICYANQICNDYGVDTITCGATIAFAMECYEKGIISKTETGGIELKFGNTAAMLEVLDQIVKKSTPLGETLSLGSARAANIWGGDAKKLLITVKNEEAPAHMPQAKKSLALIYAVNAFGADHQSSEHDWMYEVGGADIYFERLAMLGLTNPPEAGDFGPEKVKFASLTHTFYSMLDSLTLCQFVFGPAWTLYGPAETINLVNGCTGWDVDINELMKLGERRIDMMRMFNIREGFTRKDDRLPEKFFVPLKGSGPTSGVAVDAEQLEKAIDLHYANMGWSSEGVPSSEKLEELGLSWCVN